MKYTIKKKDSDQMVVTGANVADNFILRLIGLMFRESIDPDEGLIFYHAPSIHMFCMRFAIDVVFLDKDYKIIRICHSLKPWRAVNCFGSSVTIELPANKAKDRYLSVGDFLEITPNS